MNNKELENVAKNLIATTQSAGEKSIELYAKGLKTIIKPDNSPVTNGDLEVNKLLTEKIKELTPNIPIISEEMSLSRTDCQTLPNRPLIKLIVINVIKEQIMRTI